MPQRTTAEWIEILTQLDVPCSEVNRLDDLLHDPHLQAVGFFDTDPGYPPEIVRALPQPVVFQGVEAQPDQAPPALGAHTRLILRDCGYDDREIDRLREADVIREGRSPSMN